MRGDLPSTRTRVRDALGALRETLGATTNLDQLLRSPKVAPRAISSLLPDLRASCAPVQRDLQAALESLQSRFDAEAIDALGDFLKAQLDDLTGALEQVAPTQRGVSASARLALERVVGRVQHNLAGALPLLELITEVAFSSRVPLDLQELLVLLRDGDQGHGLRGTSVEAGLDEDSSAVTLAASPRWALTLIALGAALANQNAETPALSIALNRQHGASKQFAEMSLMAQAPASPRFKMVLPPVIDPTEACLRAVTRSLGVDLERSGARVAFRWTEDATL